jgi:hypothetical protein
MLAVYIVSVVFALILGLANGTIQQDAIDQVLLFLGFSVFMVVGALVVAHRPGNAIGWIVSASALLATTGKLAAEYAIYAYVTRPGSLPGATLATWYGSAPWWLVLALALVFTPLLFPTGRLLSPRWRPVAWLAGVATAVLTAVSSLQTDLEVTPGYMIANPIGVAAVGNPEESAISPVAIILLGVLTAAAFGSLVIRFRRSRGEERQQLKWFTYAAALLPLAAASNNLPAPLGDLLIAVLIVFLPVATGIAVLRYRLYDIDRIISRTLAYGLLTVLLGGGYAGVVLGLSQLLGQASPLVVAAATLTSAAAFQPARRRVQAVVDRRFDRRRYDATCTIAAFSARLRQQVDLDTLTSELLGVVEQTMQPTSVSLWLRPSVAASREQRSIGAPRTASEPPAARPTPTAL